MVRAKKLIYLDQFFRDNLEVFKGRVFIWGEAIRKYVDLGTIVLERDQTDVVRFEFMVDRIRSGGVHLYGGRYYILLGSLPSDGGESRYRFVGISGSEKGNVIDFTRSMLDGSSGAGLQIRKVGYVH